MRAREFVENPKYESAVFRSSNDAEGIDEFSWTSTMLLFTHNATLNWIRQEMA